MGTMCVLRKNLCPILKGCKWGYLIFHRKRLEPRVFCYGNNSRCHFVSVVMFMCGAKFEELCPNISS